MQNICYVIKFKFYPYYLQCSVIENLIDASYHSCLSSQQFYMTGTTIDIS